MISEKHLFLQHVGQTNDNPLMLEIERAEGIYLYNKTGKKYIDLALSYRTEFVTNDIIAIAIRPNFLYL